MYGSAYQHWCAKMRAGCMRVHQGHVGNLICPFWNDHNQVWLTRTKITCDALERISPLVCEHGCWVCACVARTCGKAHFLISKWPYSSLMHAYTEHVHALEVILTFVYRTVDVWCSYVYLGRVGKCDCPFWNDHNACACFMIHTAICAVWLMLGAAVFCPGHVGTCVGKCTWYGLTSSLMCVHTY